MHLVPVIEVEIFWQVAPSAKGRAEFLRGAVSDPDREFAVPAGLRLRPEDRRSDAWRPSLRRSPNPNRGVVTSTLSLGALMQRGAIDSAH